MIAPADIEPVAARLIGPAGASIKTEIRITPASINPFDILHAAAEDGAHFRFSLEKNRQSEPPHFILRLHNIRTSPGRYADRIILKTTSPVSPELTVRVIGIIREK